MVNAERAGIRSEALSVTHTGVGLAPDGQPGNGTSEIHNTMLYNPTATKGDFEGSTNADSASVQTWFEQAGFNNQHGVNPNIDTSTGYPPQN